MTAAFVCTILLWVGHCCADERPAAVRADALSDGTRVRIAPDRQGGTTIEIHCESGIGHATLHRQAATWPRQVILRLHLRGLESLKATVGDTTLQWSIASHGNHACTASLHAPDGTTTIDARSPYFAAVRIASGQKQIPLAEGHFEVVLPAKLLAENPQAIALSWIDFYR